MTNIISIFYFEIKVALPGFKDNFKIEKINPTINDRTMDLYALRGKNYFLPAWGCKNLDHLKGTPLFSPTGIILNDPRKSYVFKTDADATTDFPKLYDTGLKNDETGKNQQINIFIQGFLIPSKWHHCIWKHVFARSKKASLAERRLWEAYWNVNASIADIFEESECKSNEKDLSCDNNNCIERSSFKSVHAKIEETCQKLLKEIITSFESNTTKYIAVSNVNEEQYKRIEIVLIKEIEIQRTAVLFGNETRLNEAIYHYARFSGACYNWDQETPVLHIHTRTMFIDKYKKDRLWVEKCIGIVIDGRRNPNVIFTGTFNEVVKNE